MSKMNNQLSTDSIFGTTTRPICKKGAQIQPQRYRNIWIIPTQNTPVIFHRTLCRNSSLGNANDVNRCVRTQSMTIRVHCLPAKTKSIDQLKSIWSLKPPNASTDCQTTERTRTFTIIWAPFDAETSSCLLIDLTSVGWGWTDNVSLSAAVITDCTHPPATYTVNSQLNEWHTLWCIRSSASSLVVSISSAFCKSAISLA